MPCNKRKASATANDAPDEIEKSVTSLPASFIIINTTELAALILSFADTETLWRASHASSKLRAIISYDKTFQRRLFLTPDPTGILHRLYKTSYRYDYDNGTTSSRNFLIPNTGHYTMYGGPAAHARLTHIKNNPDPYGRPAHARFAGITLWACGARPRPRAPQPDFWTPEVSSIEFNPLFTTSGWYTNPYVAPKDYNPFETLLWESRQIRLYPQGRELLRQGGKDGDILRAMYLTQPPVANMRFLPNDERARDFKGTGPCWLECSNSEGITMGDVFDSLRGAARRLALLEGKACEPMFQCLWDNVLLVGR